MYFIQKVHYAILVAMVTNTTLAFKQKTCYKGLNYIFIITTNFVNNFAVRKDELEIGEFKFYVFLYTTGMWKDILHILIRIGECGRFQI